MTTTNETHPDVDNLDALIERLGGRDWRDVGAAVESLHQASDAGRNAALRALLTHPDARVRKGCADFMDHHGDDSCVPALAQAARHDSIAYVRRVAVHSLGCQRCKAAPLETDFVNLLIEVIEKDENARVRREAVYSLSQQKPDARIAAFLARLLNDPAVADAELKKGAHFALKRHDPDYRRMVDERARNASRARHEAARAQLPAPLPEPSAEKAVG